MIRLGCVVTLAAALLSQRVDASCVPPRPDCFCDLEPGEDEVLVRAEVLRVVDNVASIRILGEPFHNPENLVESGQILENLENQGLFIRAGLKGIFRVHPSDGFIIFSIAEVGGMYPCYHEMIDFPSIGMEELVQAVLSGNCYQAIYDLGFPQPECRGPESGCCSTTNYSESMPLMIVFGFLLFGKPRRSST